MDNNINDLQNYRVHKSNDLVEAKFKLPLLTQRIISVCIAKINPVKNKIENPYRFSLKEYCGLSESNSEGMHEKLRNALDDLRTRNLYKYDPELKKERIYGWVTHIDVWDNQTYDIYFHPELADDLLAKTKYTSYLLGASFKLSSKYSLRLYEISKKWESYKEKGKKKGTIVISLDKLRAMLGLDDSEYRLYADFKKRCFLKAINDINTHTDISIKYNEFKKGKKINSIELIITRTNKNLQQKPSLHQTKKQEKESLKNDELNLFDLLEGNEYDKWIEKLVKFGIPAAATIKIIDQLGEDSIKFAYDEVCILEKEGVPSLSGILINKAKSFKLMKDNKNKELSDLSSINEVINENRTWLLKQEDNSGISLMTHGNTGVWTNLENKKVILFKDPDFKKLLESSFVNQNVNHDN